MSVWRVKRRKGRKVGKGEKGRREEREGGRKRKDGKKSVTILSSLLPFPPFSSLTPSILPPDIHVLAGLSLIFQRSQIYYKTVFYVAFQQAFICFVDLLNVNHFNVCNDIVLAAEIEHFLGFGNSADHGT